MVQRRRFPAEYKREAMVMLNAQLSASIGSPGTWGVGTNVLSCWRRGDAGVPRPGPFPSCDWPI